MEKRDTHLKQGWINSLHTFCGSHLSLWRRKIMHLARWLNFSNAKSELYSGVRQSEFHCSVKFIWIYFYDKFLFFFSFTLTKYLIKFITAHIWTVIYTHVIQNIQKFKSIVAVESNQFRISPRKFVDEKSL